MADCLQPVIAAVTGDGDVSLRGLGVVDWLVVVVYAVVLLAIGFYYSRRQTTTEEYFVANRRMSSFIAGASLFATMFSTLAYIGNPGELVQNGPVMLGLGLVSLPLVYVLVGYLVIPLVMRLRVTSAYELLESRLGRKVRMLGSGIFILTRLVWMSLMLYTTSHVLVTVLGWDPRWIGPITVLAGIVTTIYTLYGGFDAVAVTDALQLFVLVLGAVFTVIYITVLMGGVDEWWPKRWASHWAPQPFFSADPLVRVTMVGTVVNAAIWWVCTAGSDQMAIQRYLSTRDAASARRAFLHSNLANVVVVVTLGLVGLAVLGFFQKNPHLLASHLTFSRNGDALFPYFVSHFLPVGVPGLVISGMLAAAMSSLSSGINSTCTVISKDFIDTLRPDANRTDAARVKSARWIALGIGVVAVAFGQLAASVPGNLVEVATKTTNIFVCPMFGLFFLAMLVPFATPFGAILGAVYSFGAAVLVGYWDLITGGPRLSFQWIMPVSFAVSIITSCLFSLVPTTGRSRSVVLAFGGCALVPLGAVVAMIVA